MSLPHLRLDQLISIIIIGFLSCFRLELLPQQSTQEIVQLLQPPPILASVTTPGKILSADPVPETTAKAIMIYDAENGAIIYQKNANQPLPIASLTKLMTGLIASEIYLPDEIITINGEEKTEGNTISLQYGENITVEQILRGLLIFSGNDAAYALANNHPQGLPGFIDSMNKKAQSLHLYQTSFENPAGFDTANQFSSAYDLAILMKEVTKNNTLQQIMSTQFQEVISVDEKYIHAVYNTNELLNKLEGVEAGKTGSTPNAKECLAILVNRDNHPIISIVLGSDDRFGETEKLIDWTYDNFTWTTISSEE